MLPVQFHLHELCHFVHTLKNNNKDQETANIEKKNCESLYLLLSSSDHEMASCFCGGV